MRQVLIDWIIEGNFRVPKAVKRISPSHCSSLQVQAQVANPVHNNLAYSALSLQGTAANSPLCYDFAYRLTGQHPSQELADIGRGCAVRQCQV
jgi:hypothetical protein